MTFIKLLEAIPSNNHEANIEFLRRKPFIFYASPEPFKLALSMLFLKTD